MRFQERNKTWVSHSLFDLFYTYYLTCHTSLAFHHVKDDVEAKCSKGRSLV